MNPIASTNRTVAAALGATLTILVAIGLTLYLAGLRINMTPSVPGWLWRVHDTTAATGQYVVVCTPAHFVQDNDLARHFPAGGKCGGIDPLLKQVAAVAGDTLRIDQHGIAVNGFILPHTQPLAGLHTVHTPRQIVPTGQIALVGHMPTSLDSRYFGVIPTQWVTSGATRLR